MNRFRVSIASLMVLVLVAAVLFTACRNASPLWAGIVYLLVLGMLGIGVLKAVPQLEAGRMTWLGFALFGLSYFALDVSSSLPNDFEDPFPPTALIDWVIGRFHTIGVGGNATKLFVFVSTGTMSTSIAPYRQIGHSILTLLFGFLGAVIGGLLAVRDRDSP